jgi:hypothetical protein
MIDAAWLLFGGREERCDCDCDCEQNIIPYLYIYATLTVLHIYAKVANPYLK